MNLLFTPISRLAIPIVVHGSHLLVEGPAGPGIVLSLTHQELGTFFVQLGEHLITGFVISVLGERDAGFLGLDDQRVLSLYGEARIVAVEGPVPGLDGELLLLEALGHVKTVGNTVAVGNDQRRTIV